MGQTSKYSIAFKGLKEGIHEFEFGIKNEFFELFDNSLVEKANILANVKFEKRSNLLTLFFHLQGSVELICDRCLDLYNHPVEIETSLFVKFGENRFEDVEDVLWISPDEDFIDIAQLLYEYTVLSIPARHVHPKNKEGKRMCDPEMLKQINKYKYKEQEKEPDHRWDALNKLRNNN